MLSAGQATQIALGSQHDLQSLQAVRRSAPVLGGNFAVWGGLYSSFECSLVAIRHKVSLEQLRAL